jgi:hypothetical protein
MELTFSHSGKLGDILFSLCFIKAMGGGKLYIHLGQYIGEEEYQFIEPLISAQPYITGVERWTNQHMDYNLDNFRHVMNSTHTRTTCESFFVAFDKPVPENFNTEPWLEVPQETNSGKIIVNRVERGLHGRDVYNPEFLNLVKENQDKCCFVGMVSEYESFKNIFNLDIEHIKVENALEMAKVIKSSEKCIMNHSMPLVIAEGLKKTIYLEIRHDAGRTDCMFDRQNLYYI